MKSAVAQSPDTSQIHALLAALDAERTRNHGALGPLSTCWVGCLDCGSVVHVLWGSWRGAWFVCD